MSQLLHVHNHALRNQIEEPPVVFAGHHQQRRYDNRTHNTNKKTFLDLSYDMFMFTLMFMLIHARNRTCIRVSFSFSLFACSHSQKRRWFTFIFAHVLVRALVGTPGSHPTDTVDHTQRVVRALVPALAVRPPHLCHRQRDGAISISSHKQQDMDISQVPPRLGAPFPWFDTVHVRKPRPKKLAIICPETWLSFVSVSTSVFHPPGTTCTESRTCAYGDPRPQW